MNRSKIRLQLASTLAYRSQPKGQRRAEKCRKKRRYEFANPHPVDSDVFGGGKYESAGDESPESNQRDGLN